MVPRLSDFEGRWLISRQIRPAGAPEAHFQGHARFKRDHARLLYHEQGELVLPGHEPMLAERRYIWRLGGRGIAVEYADGRPFHDFNPADPEARHWCDPDSYSVRYDFSAWPEWQAHWQVQGPRKDYVMQTRYRRGDAA